MRFRAAGSCFAHAFLMARPSAGGRAVRLLGSGTGAEEKPGGKGGQGANGDTPREGNGRNEPMAREQLKGNDNHKTSEHGNDVSHIAPTVAREHAQQEHPQQGAIGIAKNAQGYGEDADGRIFHAVPGGDSPHYNEQP